MLEVDLEVNDRVVEDEQVERVFEHLRSLLPRMEGAGGLAGADQSTTAGPPAGLAWAFGRLALALQRRVGCPVEVAFVRPSLPVFRVAVQYEEEALGVACLLAARRLCLASLRGEEPVQPDTELASLRELAHEVRLGPSTVAIVRAARRQSIPAFRLNDGNLVQLGQGASQRRIWTAETDRTGAIAEVVAQDKNLTRQLLRGVGVPVPEGRPVRDPDDAWTAAEEIGVPVVVKPRHGNHGRGVTTNLLTREQVMRAFAAAREHGEEIVVERFVPGSDYRLLIVGAELVAAALRQPPQVVGDGRSTVSELVADLNRDPRRSDGHATSLSLVKLDAIALAVLAEQGQGPDSVPGDGETILIRRNANLSSGGTATDVTDRVHPQTAASAVAAARAVGLDIAGVDVVAPAIDQPLQQSGGAVIEVNAGPGLRMHLDPSAGTPRPVGKAIVRMLFPAGASGRIPLTALLGDTGRTAQVLAHILASGGYLVGLAGAGGLTVGGRQVDARDSSDWQGTRAVLRNPRITAGVLEVAPSAILHEGLGFDRCDVAVVMRSPGERQEERARLERVLIETIAPGGSAVLDAGDPGVAELASACPGSVVYYAGTENEIVAAHLARAGRAVLAQKGQVVLARGSMREVVVPAEGLRIEDALASAGAAWALDLPVETIRAGLASFVVNG
jgi:cyanophycin synthetase